MGVCPQRKNTLHENYLLRYLWCKLCRKKYRATAWKGSPALWYEDKLQAVLIIYVLSSFSLSYSSMVPRQVKKSLGQYCRRIQNLEANPQILLNPKL